MAIDLYSSCPCGSGKKFKWCCQPIHVQIDKAFQQDQEGQHDAALRMMDDVVKEHPGNPEAWGRKALLLYNNERVDEAESALQKAFEINPNYPFGHLLRGLFRQHEGEIQGALLLFRRAAELYDPEAKDVLAQVYSLIGDSELKLNRPVAAHAALQVCQRLRPSDELGQDLEALFGPSSRLPAAARRHYTFQSPPREATPDKRNGWSQALAGAATGKLTDAARVFEQLTKDDARDAAACYNLGLARAWLGDNPSALAALDQYLSLENDEQRAAEAWALAEVLRFGQGMEDQADYVDHSATFQVREPQRVFSFLEDWQRERRLTGVQVREQEGMITGIVLDRTGLLTTAGASAQPARMGAYLLVLGNQILLLRGTNQEAVNRAFQEIQERLGPALSEARLARGPANFGDTLAEALVFPVGATDQAIAQQQIREHVQRYFEETWLHRPLRSLGNVAPIDAAGHPVLRKKLLGVVQFLEECAAGGTEPYDFNRLRHKLGLQQGAPAAAPAEQPSAAALDIDALNTADLGGLKTETLSEAQLEQAWRAAQRLDAQELASHFARQMVARPPSAERPDRFSWYTFLVQRALAEGNKDAALEYINAGEQADSEQNEGRRRNDYELRRGEVLAKRGEAEAAHEVFDRLVGSAPAELRYAGKAAESMLGIKQGAAALKFAERGLAKSREKNDRDSEQYFMELVAAAKKQVG
ncbi:MAG: tetratricopeptide repeat protein [Planctomycetota bacterium]|nr:MAG: tetratricopeptide repeat protein [Planctomycetota bacterium]